MRTPGGCYWMAKMFAVIGLPICDDNTQSSCKTRCFLLPPSRKTLHTVSHTPIWTRYMLLPLPQMHMTSFSLYPTDTKQKWVSAAVGYPEANASGSHWHA